MPKKRVFGHVAGIEVGTLFASYAALNQAEVHRSTQGGISSSETEGADSIVVSGGYADDQDFGDEIVYTGQGGRDASGKHIEDQKLRRGNLALVINELEGLPVRVIRGADPKSAFAPATGYRYDGLYQVDSHWHEVGKAGFKVWRYRLIRQDSAVPVQKKADAELPAVLSGGNALPVRISTTVQRIVRDTQQAKKIKKHYKYTCQVCQTQIPTAAGFYAEAAHVRALGAPHNGPDTPDNILCLCPNHHVMFDHGAFAVQNDLSLIGIAGKLTVLPGHSLDVTQLQYHRSHYLNQTNAPAV